MLLAAVVGAYVFLHRGPVFFFVGLAGLLTILFARFMVTFWYAVTPIDM